MIKTSYSKQELAKLYEVSGKSFAKFLNKGKLFELLSKNGYLKRQKMIHPRLANIIFEYLGNPFR